jgi:HSP20 family protein
LDVRETEAAYVVETDVPGMTAEAITVEAEGPYVVVKGERREEHEEGEGETKRTERTFGTFYRRVALPETAKMEAAEARYENGVLTVTVPKGEEAKAKAITVEAEEARWPRLDVHETEAAYVVETDLPGMTAEAITVEAEGPYVVVKGERRTEHEEGEGKTKRMERAFGTFYRRVALPETAKLAEAEARYVNGVLTVTVPKGEEAKRQAITVKAA